MQISEPSSLNHLVLLTACGSLALVMTGLSLIYWSWPVLLLSFLLFTYYLSEIIRELQYLIRTWKENANDR
jgi:hypothetical protein